MSTSGAAERPDARPRPGLLVRMLRALVRALLFAFLFGFAIGTFLRCSFEREAPRELPYLGSVVDAPMRRDQATSFTPARAFS